MSRIDVQDSSQTFVHHLSRVGSRLGALLVLLCTFLPAVTQAHDIPSRITVNAFVKPEGNTLTALLRVPMEAFGEISFPLRGPGFIQISEADFAIRDAARVYITESFKFYENGVRVNREAIGCGPSRITLRPLVCRLRSRAREYPQRAAGRLG